MNTTDLSSGTRLRHRQHQDSEAADIRRFCRLRPRKSEVGQPASLRPYIWHRNQPSLLHRSFGYFGFILHLQPGVVCSERLQVLSSPAPVACHALLRLRVILQPAPELASHSAWPVQQIFFPGDLYLLLVNSPDSVLSLSLLRTFGLSSVLAESVDTTQRFSDKSGKPGLRSPDITGVSF